MPKRILVEHARDFTGGLNLATHAYDLADNEFPYAKNIDPERRGGFSIRRGRKLVYNVAAAFDIDTAHTYIDPTAVRHQLIAGGTGGVQGTIVERWNGAGWTSVHAGYAGINGPTLFVQMNGTLYIQKDYFVPVRKWTGVGLAVEIPQPAYHDDLAAPTGNTFVRGHAMAVHNGVMWVGNINETIDATHKGSRLRWSHPGKPEDWRTNDWIDIDPDDGAGEIKALVPFGDRLLVFKDRAVYAVSGYPPEGFSVTAISREVGTSEPQSVTSSADTVYFWDRNIGLCAFDGREVTWPFDRLYPLLDDAQISLQFSHQASVEYHRDRVFVKIFYDAQPYAGSYVTLVFAPTVGKIGAWTLYDKSLLSFDLIRLSEGGDELLVGGLSSGSSAVRYLCELDAENYFEDVTNGTTGDTSRIDARLQTRWFDARNPAEKKRWKRPIVVVGADANQEFIVDVLDDYNPSVVRRTFSLFTDVNGVEGVWDVSDWDEVVWAAEIGADRSSVLRGNPLGTGTAKALRFSNVAKGTDWRIHGVTMKWIPKRIRN